MNCVNQSPISIACYHGILKCRCGSLDAYDLCRNLTGKLYADKGYIDNKLTEKLKRSDIDLVTTVRKNMKRKVMSAFDRAMLSKRYIIETVNDQLKNISQIEHSRHRSETGFMLNIISGIVAYCLKKQKARIKASKSELETMAV